MLGWIIVCKCKFSSSHCKLQSACLFLLGENVTDNMTIYDPVNLGDLCPWMKKHVLFTSMFPSTWKMRPISLDMLLLHFSLLGTFIRWRCSWAFPVLEYMTAFTLPGCKVRLAVAWSITVQLSPDRWMRGAGFMGEEVRVLIVFKCIAIRPCTCIWHAWVLYLCTCGNLGISIAFWCATGGIGSVSLGTIWGVCWGDSLRARPGWNDISLCGSTLRGGAGDASGVAYGIFNLGGGVTCGGEAMLNIWACCFRAAVFLSPNVMSGIVGVGLRRAWVRVATACVAVFLMKLLSMLGFLGKTPWCQRLSIYPSWGCRILDSVNVAYLA